MQRDKFLEKTMMATTLMKPNEESIFSIDYGGQSIDELVSTKIELALRTPILMKKKPQSLQPYA